MRGLMALGLGFLVAALLFPVGCVWGEGEGTTCTSVTGWEFPADVSLVPSLGAGLATFVAILLAPRVLDRFRTRGASR